MVTNILGISGDFWGAFLNVLGIVGLILIALFIVVFLADWILSTIDGREGIFFKKNRNQVNNTTNITNNYGDNYSKPQEKEEVVETQEKIETVEEPKVENDVDFEKARQEEIALAQEKFNLAQEVEEEPVEVAPEEPNYDDMIEEINNTALNAYNKAKSEEFARMVLSGEEEKQVQEDVTETTEDEEIEDFEQDAEEEVNTEENFDEIEEVEEEPETTDEVVEQEEIEEQVEEVEQPKVEENTDAQNEILRRLEEQINELKQQLEEQQRENEELKRIAEEEKAQLNALIAKRNGDDDDEGRKMIDYVGNLDELEARLEMLKERLKANEKDLRINKKEFIPLSRVKKTLESDKKKLRRREAIVAKRKVLLYGVNNYADIDEEKAKELNEELDLLEGLRLSVAHCEEVMEANKDRYPILEHTNKILTETNAQIKSDIADLEEEIEQAKALQSQENQEDNE